MSEIALSVTIIILFVGIPSYVVIFFIYLRLDRFNKKRRFTYYTQNILKGTKYILAYTYARGGYMDKVIPESSLCYIYAKANGIYVSRIGKIFSKRIFIPYSSVNKIYVKESVYYDEFMELEPNNISRNFPDEFSVPERMAIFFTGSDGKKKRLFFGTEEFVPQYITEPFNYYSMLQNNFFEYISSHIPTCALLKYTTSIKYAHPYSDK